MDAVLEMGRAIKRAAALTADRDGLACAKLVVFSNIPPDIPFMAGAYLGIGEADAVINVGVSGAAAGEIGLYFQADEIHAYEPVLTPWFRAGDEA